MSDNHETSEDQSPPERDGDAQEKDGRTLRRSRRRRTGLVALLSFAVLLAGLGIAVFALVGRPVSAPPWLKAQIEERINAGSQSVEVAFGDISLVVEEGWRPRLVMRDVDFSDAEGRRLLTLSDVEGTLSARALIRGELRPARIWLDGAQVALRRDQDGRVGLSWGAEGEPQTSRAEARNFAELIDGADRFLVTPILSSLTSVEVDGLTMRYEDARARQAWTVDGGRVWLDRAGDDLTLRGDFALLTGQEFATTLEASYTSRIGDAAANFAVSFKDMPSDDIARQSGVLLWLETLRAPISGAMRASVDETGALGPVNATLQIGAGVLQPTDKTRPIPFQSVRSYFTYLPETQTMQVDEFAIDSAWGSARAEGQVVLGDMTNGWPDEFVSQLQIRELIANPNGLYETPVRFDAVTGDFRLRLDPFDLRLGEMVVSDRGHALHLSGRLRAEPEGWDVSLEGQMDGIAPDRLVQLWPPGAVPKTRAWVEANVLSGTLSNLQIGLKSRPESKPDIYLGFEFDEAETLFLNSMPPIRKARGHATLYQHQFTVRADAGEVRAEQGGVVDISGTSFVVEDVRKKPAPARITVNSNSTITAALSLLDRKPFRFLTKAGQPVTLADGRAVARGQIDLVLKKDLPADQVSYNITADLSKVRSTRLIPGRSFSAAVLDVAVDNRRLQIKGKGRVGKVPVTGSFTAPLGKPGARSEVRGTVELSQRFVDEFRIGLPRGTVSGAGRADVAIDLQKGKAGTFSMSSNLSGVGLRVPAIGWALGQKTRGTLKVSGRFTKPMQIDNVLLNAPGLKTSGRVELTPRGAFKSARFPRVRVGSWFDGPVALIGRGAKSPRVEVQGGRMDLSKTEIGAGSGSGATGSNAGAGGPISVKLDRLRISEGISLTGFRGEFSTAKGFDGTFSGRVNGAAPVTGVVAPRNGRSAFSIKSSDAGGVFKSAGLLTNARGGDFNLSLVPRGGKGSYDGLLKVRQVRLRDAPAMAELLNAISVVGLLEQFAGSGILFQEVEARFRLTPKQAIITKSSAVGASIGISMDGIYDLASGRMNMQGVVSPIYLINGIGAVFTRKGEGLIGFNYTLKGTAETPRVGVNPLSLFTPGMFREIFRRPPPKVSP
ncbi:MAG: hypothetical protein CSA70_00990 [Rhodobacterales bacterium]|nr:MAG: hypothetical protein CSA70_00990 [Rhodobacterales bacterium]